MRVFEVRHVDVGRLRDLLGFFGAEVRADAMLRLISARGTREQIAAIEEAIKRYDVPPPIQRSVEITLHLVQAEQQADSSVKLPPELEPVVKQLRSVMSYQSFRLLDVLSMRTRDGMGANASGVLSFGPNVPNTVGAVRIGRITLMGSDGARQVRVDGFRLDLNIPVRVSRPAGAAGETQWQFLNTSIATDVDVPEGKRTVIGKSSAEGAEKAIFVVITANVVN